MHTLVAQPELLGDLPQQRTGRVEAPDGVLVADPDLVGFVVEVEGLVPPGGLAEGSPGEVGRRIVLQSSAPFAGSATQSGLMKSEDELETQDQASLRPPDPRNGYSPRARARFTVACNLRFRDRGCPVARRN